MPGLTVEVLMRATPLGEYSSKGWNAIIRKTDPYLTQFRMALLRQNNLIDLTYESPTSPDTVNGTFVASLVNETIIVKEESMENEPEKRDEKENEEADSEEKDEKEFMTPKAKQGKKVMMYLLSF